MNFMNIDSNLRKQINLTSKNIFAKINIDESKGGAYEWRNFVFIVT